MPIDATQEAERLHANIGPLLVEIIRQGGLAAKARDASRR
jgi:hypothetical protein